MKSQLGWRFNFWIATILSAMLNLLNFFTLPETVRRTGTLYTHIAEAL